MNLTHAQFQSLSACEALAMQRSIGKLIMEAYQGGVDMILDSYDGPIDELLKANSDALSKLGFTFENDVAPASFLVKSLHGHIKRMER